MSSLGRISGFSLVLFAVSACGGGSSGGGDSGTLPAPSTPAYVVATSVTGSGSGSISPTSRRVSQGNTATFTISPASNSTIVSLSGCGGSLNGAIYTTGAINGACTVTATFDLNTYTVTATAGSGGSISPGFLSVPHGNVASFTAIPNSGFEISSITGCGGDLNGATYTTGPIQAACVVSVQFATETDGSTANVTVWDASVWDETSWQ